MDAPVLRPTASQPSCLRGRSGGSGTDTYRCPLIQALVGGLEEDITIIVLLDAVDRSPTDFDGPGGWLDRQ